MKLTPKEQAGKLVTLYSNNFDKINVYEAIQISIITVDNIIEVCEDIDWSFMENRINFWKQVRYELYNY